MNGKSPDDLLWNGRAPDPEFLPDEKLFLRVPQFNEGGYVDSAHVRFPDTSVNRGKYSSPEHLLIACNGQFRDKKVAVFFVRDIPRTTQTGDGQRTFDVKIVHDPVKPPDEPEENYAHSEIRPFENGTRLTSISNVARKFVREVLGHRMRPAL